MTKKLLIFSIILVVGMALTGCSKSYVGGNYHNATIDFSEGISVDDTVVINGSGQYVGAVNGTTGAFSGTLGVTGNTSLGGDLAVTGSIIGDQKVTAIAATNQYSTTTLTAAQSGTTFLISASGTRITLPASTTAEVGTSYRFQVKGAIDTASTTIASYEGDNIEGTLIVAGAVVDCAAEDFITLASDNENVGDYVEVMYDGTSWLIQDSGILTLATCTDPS